MGVILTYLFYIAVLVLLIVTVNHLHTISYAWKIPMAPSNSRWFGHTFMFSAINTRQAFWTIAKTFGSSERMSKLMIGPIPVIQPNHPDLLQKVLTSNELYDKPFVYDFMQLGRGLITDRCGSSWKRTRKAVNPAFSLKILTGFVPLFDSRARMLIARLKPLADGTTNIDLLQYVAQCTLAMVFSTTMGCKLEERPHVKEYVEHLNRIQNSLGKRMFNVEIYLEPLYKLSGRYRREMKSRVFCNEFTDKIIQERRAKLANENNNNNNSSMENMDDLEEHFKSNIFLDEVLNFRHNGKPFSDQEVSDQLYTMMSAGNETSALSVCYACLFLAQNPELQDKVVAELREVFHSPSVDISIETLKRLEYTEMVIKETLRLVPVVPVCARETSVEIELDGIKIPRGQIILISFYNLHRRKEFWGDDPERFDPERFRPEAVRSRHPYAYLPFSGGFRNCIGSRYAMNSVKTMLARFLLEFEVRTNIRREDMRYKFEISMKLVGPHTVQLTRRNVNG